MSVLLGKIDHFDPELEGWSEYVEHLEQFFEANEIIGDENKAKRLLLLLLMLYNATYRNITTITITNTYRSCIDGLPATCADSQRKTKCNLGTIRLNNNLAHN